MATGIRQYSQIIHPAPKDKAKSMLKNISQHFNFLHRIPKLSIVIAVFFLISFLGLNVFSYVENSRRIEIINSINHENITEEVNALRDQILILQKTFINSDGQSTINYTNVKSIVSTCKKHLTLLKDNQVNFFKETKAIILYEAIEKNLNAIDRIADHNLNITDNQNPQDHNNGVITSYIQDALDQLFSLMIMGSATHKNNLDHVISLLKGEEETLMAVGGAFVFLGTIFIIFLLVDLLRRGDLLEKTQQA